jgi:hypothetical protein
MQEANTGSDNCWYHEQDGQRVGPISEDAIVALINAGRLSYGTSVWKRGFADWQRIEDTPLRTHLEQTAPPPLTGDHVNNSLVWILAFAPLLGLFLEYFVSGIMHGNTDAADVAVSEGKYWFVTLALNIGLSYFDERRLQQAGHNTDKFKGWVWLVPVYLYQRAVALKQNLAYFIVWIVCFALVLID